MVTEKEGLSFQTTESSWWWKMEKGPCVCLFLGVRQRVALCTLDRWLLGSNGSHFVRSAEELSAVCVTLSVFTCMALWHHLRLPAAMELWRPSASICDLINSPVGGEELMASSLLFHLTATLPTGSLYTVRSAASPWTFQMTLQIACRLHPSGRFFRLLQF